ncbi:hypothetical protein [uncultured Desulfobulbus sp.]|uniref:hypothetical protein n=1 Tax=uncultured Desulfobulbus sp. TaxID=239745 RepID=UPI0029C68FB0|nr:hypothetical protein [uncultured Desulfobulbus sp.]
MKKKSSLIIIFSLFIILVTLLACEENKKGNMEMGNKNHINANQWKILEKKRIVFGHQSVGNNILTGVQDLAKQEKISLHVNELGVETTDPGIIHFEIGKNTDPLSKIEDFETKMESNTLKNIDIAMFKLCYVDIDSTTDAIKLARDYIDSLDRMGKKFPNTIFIAITCPLTVVESGAKAWLKNFLGRTLYGYEENYKRKQFNDFIRNHFKNNGFLFDLAQLENNGSGGHSYKESQIEVLNPSITNDGGHLNAQGQQYIAAKFLDVLSSVFMKKKM